MSWKPIVFVGLISYSAYLWHQPLFAFNRYYIGQNDLGTKLTYVLIFFTLLLAWLTWKFIEMPFKNRNRFNRSFIFKFSIILSLFFLLFGYSFSKVFKDYEAEEKTASLLTKHSSVYFTSIRNEAVFMEHLINAQITSPDIVVIGSSRIMQIRSPDQRKLLNLGISGSSFRDIIGMTYLVDKKLKPSIIFIGVDPWLFSALDNIDARYKSLEKAYFSSLGQVQADKNSNASEFKNLIQKFYDITTFSMQIPSNDLPEIKPKKRSDGSHVYDTLYISKSQDEIEAGFEGLLKYNDVQNYSKKSHFKKVKSLEYEFIKFIEAQSLKRNVVLVLSPYHPKLFERMKKELSVIIEIEKIFRKVAKERNIQITGSYDPFVAGCNIEEFFDGMHPKDSCMNKIVSTIH
ncbi:acyltransferase family protein [Leptospira soteropolitanensis]|uniref:Acyltransferase n=1 Tax=Leptospira soteropolitanensis TaxID=2950025 RepID=A0AAW5VFE2_9LEPT|nr:acyltransferase [Leptospira soteropolitanensis]MCW7498816.1 acyltransferase [Leptospira soteropolitanensis]MCW7521592.1 acyltransferase [Leptospira soteropolitanensis]MCW7528787.1 acyltransferase [Leptospira soteropolitanensis]